MSYVEPLSDARTKLAGFFNILLDCGMDNAVIVALAFGVGCLLLLTRHLWRRRRAARLADQLLRDVVKAKDAFRR